MTIFRLTSWCTAWWSLATTQELNRMAFVVHFKHICFVVTSSTQLEQSRTSTIGLIW